MFPVKLVVGLGNPGSRYLKTRHNAGFMVVDRLAEAHAASEIPRSRFHSACVEARIGGEKCLLLKPTTYMNRSGLAVGEAVRFYKASPETDLVVIVDEVAFPVGHIRIRARGGTAGHNGLKDIDAALGGADYPRIRVGIGNRPAMMNQADWVLSRVTDEEWPDFERSIRDAADAVELLFREGVDAAMNRYNERLSPQSQDGDQTRESNNAGIDPGWIN
ncbi:MAG TPA: aminoacyl-tRNA hydrolase [Phycisphaerales bacterium]|nr:aminoacyl-tRNA hydrolase [Phycisphaerales bacterium]